MTTEEAAAYLGVNDSRVRQLVRGGELVAERETTRRGDVLWFQRAELDALKARRAEQAQNKKGKPGRPFKRPTDKLPD